MGGAPVEDRPHAEKSARARPDGPEAVALIRCFGSPLFVYDVAEVERCYHRFVAAFPYEPLDCHYAIVCNKNPLLVRTLVGLGAGIHANTPGDAFAALAAGVPARRIVYSGTNLSEVDFDYLLSRKIPLNLDSVDQISALAKRGARTSFGVRFLIDDVTNRNRIGLDQEDLKQAVAIARSADLKLTGLHVYVGTNTLRVSRFMQALDRVAEAAETLPDLRYIDLGGGYGIRYRPSDNDLDLVTIGRAVAVRLRALSERRGHPLRLVLEPGRIIVGSAGTLLATVVSVKERGGRRYVGVDTTVGNVVVRSVYHGYHQIDALQPRGPALPTPTDVCGNTTHSGDFLGRDLRLPHLEKGDILALRDVGAYAYAMSSHFLNRPRPAEVVLVDDNAVLTTRREVMSDLVALHDGASPT